MTRLAQQPDWGQLFGLIGERAAQAQKAILDAQIKIRDVDRQIKDQEGKLASLAPTQQARTEVKVSVNAGGPLEADIVIRYQVRNASWTPFYDARLTTGTKAQAPKLRSCGAHPSSSAPAKRGTTWRLRCRRRVLLPARPLLCSAP